MFGEEDLKGIIPRSGEEILLLNSENLPLTVSFLEIYNEKIFDLIQDVSKF
jgi:hypothetical protein